jgi:hypothetical protein
MPGSSVTGDGLKRRPVVRTLQAAAQPIDAVETPEPVAQNPSMKGFTDRPRLFTALLLWGLLLPAATFPAEDGGRKLSIVIDQSLRPDQIVIWFVYFRPEWGKPAQSLRLQEFVTWGRDRLIGHQSQTGAWVEVISATTTNRQEASP